MSTAHSSKLAAEDGFCSTPFQKTNGLCVHSFFSLLALMFTTAISLAGEITIIGILKQETHAGTKSEYFLIETAKPVSKETVKASKLQLAGLDQKAWSEATKFIGKQVAAK